MPNKKLKKRLIIPGLDVDGSFAAGALGVGVGDGAGAAVAGVNGFTAASSVRGLLSDTISSNSFSGSSDIL